jgi:hypothetical protein
MRSAGFCGVDALQLRGKAAVVDLPRLWNASRHPVRRSKVRLQALSRPHLQVDESRIAIEAFHAGQQGSDAARMGWWRRQSNR